MSDRIELYDGAGTLLSVSDTRTLDEVKRGKWDELNAYRELQLANHGLWYMGHWWDASDRARSNITGAITTVVVGVPLPSGFVWRDNDNNNVPFTATNLITLGSYMALYVNEVYGTSWYFKTIIDSLTSLAALDATIIADLPWPDGNMDGTRPIYFNTSALANAAVSTAYTQAVSIGGGVPPYTLSVTSGSLPTGLSIANTTISGTPTTSGSSTFTLTATDSTANTALIGNATFTLTVN